MAQHDFINKKRPSKKSKQAPKKKPVFVIIITAILTLSGIYGLWYISTNSDKQAKLPLITKKAPPAPPAKREKPVEKPFIDEIQGDDLVKVEVKELEQKGPYVMQCGSYKIKSQAESLKAKVAFAGIISHIKHQGSWYKVRLGPYATKRMAESDKNKLQRQRIIGCSIWLWK
jgi:cell division protein FtsN